MRKNKKILSMLFAVMVIGAIYGWVYEVVFYWINGGCKEFYMRGSTFGPWIDLYGGGALLILLTTWRIRNKPVLVAVISGISCGILEYFGGWLLYTCFDGARKWNYNIEILNFGNINGYVCLRSILVFMISGVLLMNVVLPSFLKTLDGPHGKEIGRVAVTLGCIFLIDCLYNDLLPVFIKTLPTAEKIYSNLGVKYLDFNEYHSKLHR